VALRPVGTREAGMADIRVEGADSLSPLIDVMM
jgi:hypothetical protein